MSEFTLEELRTIKTSLVRRLWFLFRMNKKYPELSKDRRATIEEMKHLIDKTSLRITVAKRNPDDL